jgi:hypothetical protein
MYDYRIKKEKEIILNYEKYFKNIKLIEKINFLFKKIFVYFKVKKKIKADPFFFLKKYDDSFINKQKRFLFKNKIPSYFLTEMYIYRLPPIYPADEPPFKFKNDFISMGLIDEMPQFQYYRDISKRSCLRNIFFKTYYVEKKYPYNINKKGHAHYIIKKYFNTIDTGIKISKKFYFFDRNKLRNFNKLSHRFLVKLETVYGNQLLKYKY